MHLQSRARRCLCRLVAVPSIAVLTSPLWPLSAFATDPVHQDHSSMIYVGVAAADGMRMQFVVPGAPGGNTVMDAGGPSAQAVATSAGTVRGFAAFPDPGETPRSLPTTGAGVLASNGLALPFRPPDWPMVASSDYPGRPTQEVASGPLQLKATSSDAGAEGLATFGNPGAKDSGGGFSAAASVKKVTDGIVSRAIFRSDALTAGEVVLGRVVATAQMAMGGDGQLTPSSALEVIGAQIGDTKFSISRDGFVFGTTTVPVPIAEGLKNLNQALAPTGMAVQYSPERKTANGVVAPVLEVTAKSPSDGFQGTFSVAVGGVSASLEGSRTQEDDEAVADSTYTATPGPSSEPSGLADAGPALGTPNDSLPASPSVTASDQESASFSTESSSGKVSSPAGTSVDTTETAMSDQPYGADGSVGSSTSAALPPPTAASSAEPSAAGIVPASSLYRLGSVYGMIAAAALLSVLVVELVARIGVRRPWNS
jgi:hypothetical protein